MGLYNMLHGVSGNSDIALAMLGLTHGDCGRFRDAWIEPGGERIAIFTRNGGGNREEYQDVLDALSGRAGWIEDFDDNFDYTYATIVFKTPEPYLDLARRLAPTEPLPTLLDKTNAVIEAIKPTMEKRNVPADAAEHVIEAVRAAVDAERSERRGNHQPPREDIIDEAAKETIRSLSEENEKLRGVVELLLAEIEKAKDCGNIDYLDCAALGVSRAALGKP